MSKCDRCIYDVTAQPEKCLMCSNNEMRIFADNFTSKETKLCDDIIASLSKIRDEEDIIPEKTVLIAAEYDDDEANAVNQEVKFLREAAYKEGVIAAIRAVALIRRDYME